MNRAEQTQPHLALELTAPPFFPSCLCDGICLAQTFGTANFSGHAYVCAGLCLCANCERETLTLIFFFRGTLTTVFMTLLCFAGPLDEETQQSIIRHPKVGQKVAANKEGVSSSSFTECKIDRYCIYYTSTVCTIVHIFLTHLSSCTREKK